MMLWNLLITSGRNYITVLRDGKEVEVKMTPVLDEEENIYKMGVYHDNYDVKRSIF